VLPSARCRQSRTAAWLAGALLWSAAAAAQDLRLFTIDKPRELLEQERRAAPVDREPPQLPAARDRLRTSVGMGYVQGADWGAEIATGGAVKGVQVQSAVLLTRGTEGYLFDNGAISLFDPDVKWRAELGDVFSHLRGASRGARFSWSAAGHRQPAIAVYGPRRGISNRSTVVSYRDQLVIGDQRLFDGEIASDRSYFVRSRFAIRALEMEGVYRAVRQPVDGRDASVFVGYTLPGGITLSTGVFRSIQLDERNDWHTLSLRFPLSRHLNVGLERTFSATRDTTTTNSAAMANISAGSFRFFHRHQFGDFERESFGLSESLERQQTQSAASYRAGARFDVTLQMASQRTESGLIEHWEEVQATAALTRSTTLRVATAVPDLNDPDRFRALLRQELPAQFAVNAEYGRVSAFQYAPFRSDKPRFKVMLFKSWNIGTPTRGAVVRGQVIDHTRRPVAGARVRLGRYHVDTGADGRYVFRNVPRGDYELALVSAHLPADYAWDGRRVQLALTAFTNVTADLVAVPLNSIHGRVYVDRNRNGRYDAPEGLARVVLHLGDQLTSANDDGSFSFYNVNPGTYNVRLNREKLPADVEIDGSAERAVELGDSGPPNGVEFRLTPKVKPIIFQRPEP
jgi:hypothetical protein